MPNSSSDQTRNNRQDIEKMSSTPAVDSRKRMIKYKKAPDAPKRFKSAFIFYSTAKHKEIREQLGREKASTQKTTHIAKVVSQTWKDLSPKERAKWLEMARTDKARYEKEKANYSGTWRVATTLHSKNPDAPKKPMSAFLAFSNGKRKLVKEANPDLNSAGLSRTLADMWKNAPEEERQKHIDEEFEKRQKYKEAMNIWRKEEDKKLEQEQLAIRKANVPEAQGNSHQMPSEVLVAATSNTSSSSHGKTKKSHKGSHTPNPIVDATLLQVQENNQVPGDGNNVAPLNGTAMNQHQTSFHGNVQQNGTMQNFNFQGQGFQNQVFVNQAYQMNGVQNQNMLGSMGMQAVPAGTGTHGWPAMLQFGAPQQNQHAPNQHNLPQQLSQQQQQQLLSVMSQTPHAQQFMQLGFNPMLINQTSQLLNVTDNSTTTGGSSDQNQVNLLQPGSMFDNYNTMSVGKGSQVTGNNGNTIGTNQQNNVEKLSSSSFGAFSAPVKQSFQEHDELPSVNLVQYGDANDDNDSVGGSVSSKGDWPPLPNFFPE